jgi:peptide methionine sulfoxide reductase MsrA
MHDKLFGEPQNLHKGLRSAASLFLAITGPTARSQLISNGRKLDTIMSGDHTVSIGLSRRKLLASAVAVGGVGAQATAPARADEEEIDVYFGCGCFWHVQHEFAEAERRILGRSDKELTARVGYAGGNGGAKDGKVCYHNAAKISDYGSLGHAEVVRLRMPPSKFGDFAKEYFKLFDTDGNRPDQLGDRGLEYRNVVGVPGGSKSLLAQELVDASKSEGDKLDFSVGKGSDADRRAVAYVMDTQQHPFYLGEIYHQFHDGFNWGENYPDSYNRLANDLVKEKLLPDAGCPNGMLGVGIAGL